MKYIRSIRKFFKRMDKPAFSFYEVLNIDIPKNYAKVLLHNMVKRNEIYRIRKGWYTFHADPIVFIFTLPPNTSYYGLGFAAYLYGVWDQVANPEILTYVAPRKIRVGTYYFLDTPIIVRRISKRMFYGYDFLKYKEWFIPVSCPEKILIDMVYYNYPFIEEILKELIEKIDFTKLNRLLTYNKKIRKKVLEIYRAYRK